MTAVVQHNAAEGFKCYGAAAELWRYKGHEAMLSGPFETGKTIASLHKLNALLLKYPKARALMVRKTYKSLINSAVVTYEQKVLEVPPEHPDNPIVKFGKSKPEWYDYPNGSRLVLGGMDNADKVLSAEYDFIYVNQAEELALDDWEKLTGRCTGRAGNSPYAQMFGDCNPGHPTHWIKQRAPLRMFNSRHRDNPVLYDPVTGEITEQGRRTMAVLDALTGVRYKRGRLGLWAGAEGQVYEGWDDTVHVIDWFEPPKDWRRIRSIDFGFTNPFVCQWWALDHDDRMYRYRELYQAGLLVEDAARLINEASVGERIEATVADHDAEDRATLERYGIKTIAANKQVKTGIEAVQARVRVADDGKPRIFLMRDALIYEDETLIESHRPTNTAEEVPSYIWQPQAESKAAKEAPIKVDDHGMDTMRYAVMYIDDSPSAQMRRADASGLYPSQRRRKTKAGPRH